MNLNILIVEDSDDDFVLLRHELSKGPFSATCVRADTETTFRSALDSNSFDIVISDYSVGGFNALHVLRIIKESHPHLPCIIVSGTIGEETAVQAIQAGAKDYVLKDRLHRLVSAIEREVSRNRTERAQELLSRASHDALWDWDLGLDIVRWNDGLKALFGYDIEGQTTRSEWGRQLIHPDDRDRVHATVRSALKGQFETWLCEYRLRRSNGEYAYVLDRAYIIRNSEGRMIRAVGAMIDLTPQKQAELRILAGAQQLKQAQQVARMGSFELDAETRVYSVSEEFYRICELPLGTLINMDIRMRAVHPDDRDRVLRTVSEAMRSRKPYELQYRTVQKPGSVKYLHARAEPVMGEEGKLVAYVGVLQDITERVTNELLLKQKEEQLLQLQKMDAIGRLAGGIAHDYNNMLAAIQMYTELAQNEAPDSIKDDLEQILSIVARGAALTRQLLMFSRKSSPRKESLNLSQSVRQIEKMLIRLIGETVTLNTESELNLRPIMADPGQIDQVLLNLVVNSRDAMPNGGEITVRVRNFKIEDELVKAGTAKLEPGAYVHLSVQDSGCGIAPEIQQKIFEPFFTTKPIGQGTGLGLSTVYGIMQEHAGQIAIYSEVNKGTVFNLYFPAVLSENETISVEANHQVSQTGSSAGFRVLLVEDEEDLQTSLKKNLTQRGFDVVTADNGQEALVKFSENPASFQMVITDLTMPVLGGIELARRLRTAIPDLPMIFMSGYTANEGDVSDLTTVGFIRFISKPFSVRTLVSLMQECLTEN